MLNPIFIRSWHDYLPLKFEFRGYVVLERVQLHVYGGRDAISFLLPCVLVYTYSVILEFKQFDWFAISDYSTTFTSYRVDNV